MKHIIYGLRDPRTMEIRYVGRSSSGMLRPLEHRRPSVLRGDAGPKVAWIREMLSVGIEYDVVVLEVLPCVDALDEAERRWIAVGRAALGERFTNATSGGQSGNDTKRTLETCARMSAAWTPQRRAAQAERARINLIARQKGRPLSGAHRERLSEIAKSRSAERALRFSKINKGRVFTPEHRAKLAAAWVRRKQRHAVEVVHSAVERTRVGDRR